MIFNVPQILVVTGIATLIIIVIPATLHWIHRIFRETSNSLLIYKKYLHLSLLTAVFCVLWLTYQPVPITVWIVHKSSHFNPNSFTVYLLYHQFIDCFFHACVLWCIVAKYWMLFFRSHWTSITMQYIWIHIRGPSTRNPHGFVDISNTFWIQNQSSLGQYSFIHRRVLYILCFIFVSLVFLCQLSLHDILSLHTYYALCFSSCIVPYVCITLLWRNMPSHYEDNICFKTQMRTTAIILALLFILRAIVFLSALVCSVRSDVYYALSVLDALCTIFSVMYSQMHLIQNDKHTRATSDAPMYTNNDIVRHCLKSEKLTQIFIHHLSKEMCLEYLFAFVELTQFRHLLEKIYPVYEPLPESHYTTHHERVDLPSFIPRSSIVHNKKYSQYLSRKKRIAKIARKLVYKYFQTSSVLEIFLDETLKGNVMESCEYEQWDALLVQFEVCRVNVHQRLTESVQRLCRYQNLNSITEETDTLMELEAQDIRIELMDEFISNDWVTEIDPKRMSFDSAIVFEQFMRSFPSHLNVLNLFKINKNYERNVTIYESILETLENKTERILFHGTSMDNIKRIVCNGFNPDYNTRSAYGKGVYFATKSNIARRYCVMDTDSGCSAILICRVIVGNYTIGRRPMEGERDSMPYQYDAITQYDSLVDDVLCPTVFVINRDYRAIPQYIVVFKN
eukprot:68406_1